MPSNLTLTFYGVYYTYFNILQQIFRLPPMRYGCVKNLHGYMYVFTTVTGCGNLWLSKKTKRMFVYIVLIQNACCTKNENNKQWQQWILVKSTMYITHGKEKRIKNDMREHHAQWMAAENISRHPDSQIDYYRGTVRLFSMPNAADDVGYSIIYLYFVSFSLFTNLKHWVRLMFSLFILAITLAWKILINWLFKQTNKAHFV